MSKPMSVTLRRVFSALLSISLVAAGACLIGGCLHIYFGEGAYSRELVANVFQTIAIPVWIAVGLLVISIVWELLAPSDEEYHKAPKAYGMILARLYQSRDTSEQAEAIRAEQRRRKIISVTHILLILIGLLVFFSYAVQPANYTEDINASVVRAMWVAIPCIIVPMLFSVIAAHLTKKSYEAEIALLKSCPVCGIAKETSPDVPSHTPLNILRVISLVLAVAALIYGFTAGGTADVLTKAINICTECIGLG